MTLEEAKGLYPGQILHHAHNKNSDGTPQRWRVNGQVKTWKRDPSRVRVPLKHGIWAYGYLDETCLDLLEIPKKEGGETK